MQLLSAILLPLIPVIVQLAGSVFPVLVQVITILAQALVPVIELFTRIVTWLMPLVVGCSPSWRLSSRTSLARFSPGWRT